MKPQSKPGKKAPTLSLDKKTLAAEWAANLPARAERATEFAAQLRPFSPEEREAFFALLVAETGDKAFPLLEALRGRSEELDTALARGCGQASSSQAVDFLVRWAGKNPSKSIGKEIRKSLFRLKSRGIPVPDLEDSSPPVFRPPRAELAEGYISAVDAGGSRAVWLGLLRPPQGMLFVTGIFRDTEGILNLAVYESSRKKFLEFMDQVRRDSLWDIVDAEPDYCAALIHEAHEMQIKLGKAPNPEFLKLKGLWRPSPSLPVRPLIYRHLQEEDLKARPELLDRSPSLFEKDSFRLWFLEKEELAKCLSLLDEAGRSRIILPPHQQESRFFEIYQKTVQELFDEKRRFQFRRRLEEMAYILWKKSDEAGAKIALAAALGLAEEDKFLSPHPFLLELVKRSVLFLKEEERQEEEKKKGGGLIIQP